MLGLRVHLFCVVPPIWMMRENVSLFALDSHKPGLFTSASDTFGIDEQKEKLHTRSFFAPKWLIDSAFVVSKRPTVEHKSKRIFVRFSASSSCVWSSEVVTVCIDFRPFSFLSPLSLLGHVENSRLVLLHFVGYSRGLLVEINMLNSTRQLIIISLKITRSERKNI